MQQLRERGEPRAYLYGADEHILGGLNSFYLLVDEPEVYGLPRNPQLPTRRLLPSSILSALGEEGWLRWSLLQRLGQGMLRVMIAVIGGILGFFVAGYTGGLLSVTNRPIWADTDLLGLLFVFSAASTAAAALILLGLWRGPPHTVVHWLARLDSSALVLELLALVALVGYRLDVRVGERRNRWSAFFGRRS